jgi:hypothetical protein
MCRWSLNGSHDFSASIQYTFQDCWFHDGGNKLHTSDCDFFAVRLVKNSEQWNKIQTAKMYVAAQQNLMEERKNILYKLQHRGGTRERPRAFGNVSKPLTVLITTHTSTVQYRGEAHWLIPLVTLDLTG